MKLTVKIGILFIALSIQIMADSRDNPSGGLLDLAQKWQMTHSDIYELPITSLNNVQEITSEGEIIVRILFPAEGGYIIFSASQAISPFIAVSESYSGDFISENHPLVRLLKVDIPNRQFRAETNPEEQLHHTREWAALLSSGSPTVTRLDTIILNETPPWGQGWTAGAMVFNLFTPNHWSTGCVATALAEILTYYHWPPRGTGSNSYWDNGIYHSVNFSDYEYDWENTLDNYAEELSTPIQKEAAGLLSYHTAVSVNMDFEAEGSTANTADGVTALHYHFRCSGHYMSASTTGFLSEVIANLEDGRPVVLAVNGAVDHAVVADGYANQYGLFHINYGWDGDSNGWYDITDAFLPGYNYTLIGGLKGIVPNPMISDDIDWIDEDTFDLKWLTSHRLYADHFELQQKLGNGNWISINSSIQDTSFTISVSSPGTYHYRVRAYRDGIWWDWSREMEISIGNDVTLEFLVDMQERPLMEGEALVLLGNIAPLGNVQNSPEFTYQSDHIYATEVTFENSYVGQTLSYRFGVTGAGNPEIESFNREYELNAWAYQSLDTVRFNRPVSIEVPRENNYPISFSVGNIFPNPFNGTLNIPLEIGEKGRFTFDVFDLRGRALGIGLTQELAPGLHQIQLHFNSTMIPSGIYIIRIDHKDMVQILKCQLIK